MLQELVHKQVFSNQNSLLFDHVVELRVLGIEHLLVVIVVFLVVIINVVLLHLVCVHALCVLVVVFLPIGIELVNDVFDLPFELLVTLFHQILQDFGHAKFFCLLSQLFSVEQGVERPIHKSSHLKIFVLNQVIKDV